MSVTEKVAYLKGLMDGLELDKNAKETKVLNAVVETLDGIAKVVSDLKEESAVLFDVVDAIDEDLRTVEEIFEEEDDDDHHEGCGCGGHHHDHHNHHHEHETIYETSCPACGEVINLDESLLSVGEIKCPACGENLEFGFDDDEEEEIIAIETDKKSK